MGIQVALQHRTEYRYERAVALGPQTVQLRPAPHCRTSVLSYSLEITPPEGTLRWGFDALGNHVARVGIAGKTESFALTVNLLADLEPYNPFDFIVEPGSESFPLVYSADLATDLAPFLMPQGVGPKLGSNVGPNIRAFLAGASRERQSVVSFLVGLNQRLQAEIGYNVRLEHGVQSPEETLGSQSGSCRDSAWLLVEICRQVGLAARFVSGYLIQLAEDEVPGVPRTGPSADSADLHAWAEVYLPGAGWIGFDPTSGLLAAEGHLPLACAPTPAQTAPVRGTVEPAGVTFTHSMTVRRMDEPARFAKPYSDAVWERVRAVAHAVDRDLEAQDVRLTMGGEPTFVGIDEPESLQWNFEALGPIKRTRGLEMIWALRARTAPGGLLHLGQGKWYPNEALPRWAFMCLSRVDGVPIWEDGSLFASHTTAYGFGDAEAKRFMEALTRRLGVSAEDVLPAFNFGAAEGADTPAGYALPLRRRQPGGRLAWSSQLWFERPERLVLSPGDSPVGYRLPVEAMPWVAPDDLVYEKDAAGEIALPARPARHPEMFGIEPESDTLPPAPEGSESAPLLIRPALCVEVREGRLHVFLPFVPVLADYLHLVAAVEDTCRHLKLPIWVEGYPPNFDPRVRSFGLTPDPGVLEVNLPPTSAWDDLEALNAVLAEEAHRYRLIEGKFGFDGSHVATGGGSHIVLGGGTTGDSPILRRPDLLRSMLIFWQNHPSLSYMFAGMYVGPTSQYPRIDEARTDALYEAELSFSYLPAEGCSPSTLDGLFRNLLVDVTGNTHRAEFCIDKLYPPEGAGLRAGLLELRAFEMAPHFRMGLLQMLLVRALVAGFWREPFHGGLVRWGTALHDRFMLPYFVEKDFAEVLEHLRRAGFPFEDNWFRMHAEFRFPAIGTMRVDGVTVELRVALEPWNVLAEETSAGGTGRSVDSSLERVQVRVTGLSAEDRYLLACNGRRVPLQSTGVPGEAVAGIRYRARRLNATLHPTIPVHLPLQFDLLDSIDSTDTRKSRVAGRCAYFAGPPDGTVYTTLPTNATEARERRLQRFQIAVAPTEPVSTPVEERNPAFPMTLDLRWPAPASHAPAPQAPALQAAVAKGSPPMGGGSGPS